MTFEPPTVVYKRPQIETFIAFLQSKGWTLEDKTNSFCSLRAPDNNGEKQNFTYRIPANENSRTFDELAHLAVETFADIYDIPLQDLFDLLSLSLADIQKDVERQPRLLKMKKAILANAS
ncbi:MAG: hypothetical protein H6577_09035 [Lewinellaceae bacterium]|nr:hypothetical protein [Saprospiraceae bacterium]MCB9338258.1 hypothetical protein [Lewinellaceae bacterium]